MSPNATGIDVSLYQGNIDWKLAKADKVDFAFIKATEGISIVDSKFYDNWAAAKEAFVIRGAYHYFIPNLSAEAQADHFCNVVSSLTTGDLAPALDVENPEAWTKLSKEASVDLIFKWCDAVMAKLQMRPFIYANPSFVTDVLGNDARLVANFLWLAQYTNLPAPTVPKPWSKWTFWQHSESGKVDGVPEAVDLDYFAGSLEDLMAIARS